MRRREQNKRRRIERQEEATARQATYDAMSIAAKVALTVNRPGGSHREFARLFPHIGAESIGAVRLA